MTFAWSGSTAAGPPYGPKILVASSRVGLVPELRRVRLAPMLRLRAILRAQLLILMDMFF